MLSGSNMRDDLANAARNTMFAAYVFVYASRASLCSHCSQPPCLHPPVLVFFSQCMRSVTLPQTATAWSHPAKSGTMSGAYDESASQEETTDSFWEVRQQGTAFDRLNLSGKWHSHLMMNSHWTCLVWEVRRKMWGLVYYDRVWAQIHT